MISKNRSKSSCVISWTKSTRRNISPETSNESSPETRATARPVKRCSASTTRIVPVGYTGKNWWKSKKLREQDNFEECTHCETPKEEEKSGPSPIFVTLGSIATVDPAVLEIPTEDGDRHEQHTVDHRGISDALICDGSELHVNPDRAPELAILYMKDLADTKYPVRLEKVNASLVGMVGRIKPVKRGTPLAAAARARIEGALVHIAFASKLLDDVYQEVQKSKEKV